MHILRQIQHDNILRYRAHFLRHRVMNIVVSPFPTCSLASLSSAIGREPQKPGAFGLCYSKGIPKDWVNREREHPFARTLGESWNIKLWFLHQAPGLASALGHLHALQLAHNDISTEHVVIADGKLLLCNFLKATDFKIPREVRERGPGTDNTAMTFAQDIYSLGAVFVEMAAAVDWVIGKRSSFGVEKGVAAHITQNRIDKMIDELRVDAQSHPTVFNGPDVDRFLRWLSVTKDMLALKMTRAEDVLKGLEPDVRSTVENESSEYDENAENKAPDVNVKTEGA